MHEISIGPYLHRFNAIRKRCKILFERAEICVNPLPDDKILDWSKLKQIAKMHLK